MDHLEGAPRYVAQWRPVNRAVELIVVSERGSLASRKNRYRPQLQELINLRTAHLLLGIQKLGNFELETIVVGGPLMSSRRSGGRLAVRQVNTVLVARSC